MGVDFESFRDVLKHPIRRKVVLALSERKSLSYVELMGLADAASTGKFNYHLKVLGDLIAKDPDGKYVLTEKGQLAAQFLQKFPEKKIPQGPLRMADAALIGFAGVLLMAINPVFLISGYLALHNMTVPEFSFFVFGTTAFIYAVIVPGAVMWRLSVNRAHSHDMYDLLKPWLTLFILTLTFLVLMYFTKVNPNVTLSSPRVQISAYGYRSRMMPMSLAGNFASGILYSFFGVLICEFASRMRKKWALRN